MKSSGVTGRSFCILGRRCDSVHQRQLRPSFVRNPGEVDMGSAGPGRVGFLRMGRCRGADTESSARGLLGDSRLRPGENGHPNNRRTLIHTHRIPVSGMSG
jgi:hypothetical protein